MKKKVLSIFLSILLVFSAIPFMNINSFATDNECSIYGHSFGDWETIQYVTCAQEGIDRRTCTVCGVYEEEITPINPYHNFVVIEDVPATCVSDGYQVMECDVCFFTDTLEYSATGHRDSNNDGACDICEFYSGVCGDNLTWSYYGETGTLTISGTGEINDTPWTLYEDFIKEIVIEDGVTSIGVCAFDRLGALTTVTIPDSVTSIESRAFSECEKLTEITLPDGLTTISSYLFLDCSSLTTVTIPDSVTSIGTQAFKGCTALTAVTIPDSVTSIGTSAFSYCESLTEITLPNKLTVIPNSLLSDCLSLTTVTIPDSVTSIKSGAFAWCEKLTEITLPDGLTIIDDYLFRCCSSLTNITIPDSVTSIGYMAFEQCKKLTEITLPNELKTIDSRSFFSCSSLTTVTVPDSVTQIEDRAFAYSSKITDVYYSGTEEQWNLITIGTENEYLTNATIHFAKTSNPSGTCGDNLTWEFEPSTGTLTISGTGAMQYVTSHGAPWSGHIDSIESVVISEGVTTIGDSAFYNHENIKNVSIADSVTDIGDKAFYNCTGLTDIVIGKGVTTIGEFAFENCSNLKPITIYNAVEKIGRYAFNGCPKLTDVYYLGTEAEWNAITKATLLSKTGLENATIHYNYGKSFTGIKDDYFYKDDVKQKAYQLVEFEGDFYFINDYHKIAKNKRIYLSETFVEGFTYEDGTPLVVGYYEFDESGKMIIKNGVVGDYFYKNGVRLNAYQLVEYEGDFYFINDSHKVAKNKRIYLSQRFVDGFTYEDGTPLKVGYYEFDENGKMVILNGPVGDYFYKNNVRLNAYQLVEYEGNYYFINDSHKLAKNKRLYMSQIFVEGTDLKVGYYDFDADGKLIIE